MGFDALMHAFGMTLQVGFIDLILSGDNALVIALACRALAPKQMRKAMLIGSGAAIGLRILFTLGISALLDVPGIKLVGSVALLVIAVRLLISDDEDDAAKSETAAASDLWSAVTMVVIADVVMSLDNVIAIAASADIAAARVDFANAASIKATLIIFGLATSVPLIVAGSAILMALLERFRVLVWTGGALLGWVAGDIMATDPVLAQVFSETARHALHDWGGPVGGLIVVGIGYGMVRQHRRLYLDEVLAGLGLLIWIVVDRFSDAVFGGAKPDLTTIWSIRGVLVVAMAVAYVICRKRWHVERRKA